MAAGAQTRGWTGPSRRRLPRFRMQAPLDVMVSRAGATDVVPGRAINVSERGIGAVVAGELLPGETVGVEVRVPSLKSPVRTHAIVRYQDKLRCGLEFAPATPEQRDAVQEVARSVSLGRQATATSTSTSVVVEEGGDASIGREEIRRKGRDSGSDGSGHPPKGRKRRRRAVWIAVFALAVIAAGAFWWKWNHDWEQLEAGLNRPGSVVAEKPQAQVPAEVMQKLLVHRVEPVYPPAARKQNLQGVIALDIVIGRDGSVVSMHALNGPDILAKAAMETLRWWKFEPYRINGAPATVETTVAVEFKR